MLILVLFHTFMTDTVIPRISSLIKARKASVTGVEASEVIAEVSSAVYLANNILALTANYCEGVVETSVKKSSIST
jgi:hypothetical protein